jgi:cytochrome c7-like protein
LAQLFPKRANYLALILAVAGPLAGTLAIGGVWYYGSPRYTDVGYRPHQPVPYSHALHAGEMGIDCRYCHATVEVSSTATVPPTQTCMNCHRLVKKDSQALAPIRDSAASGRPMRWIRVHNLPDYVYFNHSVHIRAGVGCVTCHGRIDQMAEVTQAQPLSMSWCLDCHRNPAPNLRPTESVTDMEWYPPANQNEVAAAIIRDKKLAPPVDCSGCHR